MTGERDADFRRLYRQLRIRDQHVYYQDRRDEYDRAHRQAVITRNLLLMIAGVCGVVGQTVEGPARAGWSVGAAVLGGVAAALIGFEALIGFSRLSKLYADVARNLAEADLDWDDPNSTATTAAEMHRVEEVLRAENGQWGQLVVESAAPPPALPEATTGRNGTPGESDPPA